MCILDYNEIYNYILKEFHISSSIFEQMKLDIEGLCKSRIDICKLLKIKKISAEIIVLNEKEIINNIILNKYSIENYEKKQIDLIDKIKTCKQDSKVIKFDLKKSEDKLNYEKQESKDLRESLSVFLKREKFKFMKKIFVQKYIKVYLKYSNQLSIKKKIYECNERKAKLRKDKEYCVNKIEKNIRKINSNKKELSETRKKIINMKKCNEFSIIKMENLNDYKEVEKKFRIKIFQYEKLNEKRLD